MGIEKLDRNFDLREKVVSNGEKTYTIPSSPFDLYGVYYDSKANGFVRMDLDIASKISEGVCALSRHTAGGRLCFRTDSATLKITVTYSVLGIMSHMPLTGSSGFSLCERTKHGEVRVKQLAPLYTDEKGFSATTQLRGGMREYILYFPLYNDVFSLQITLDKNARVEHGSGYRNVLPILYYGSSITQGGCASRPDNSYQALICRRNGIDFINLGFSGNAKAESEMISYLGGIDCSLFVCDYDHNAPTAAYLKDTHYS
ncbi:MAG: hypothetical protein IJX49_05635 [Clostridia bacterium]|nr:hypothetical protein [Clostridia bacterium]